jgi:hypothetical protein
MALTIKTETIQLFKQPLKHMHCEQKSSRSFECLLEGGVGVKK